MADILIHNVQIFDGTGAPLRPGAVAITGDLIIGLAWGADALAGETAATLIDGGGRTLIPAWSKRTAT